MYEKPIAYGLRMLYHCDTVSRTFLTGVGPPGIETSGVVRCDQPRVLDLAARHARKVDTLTTQIMDEVLAKVATLFE